VTFLFTDLEGSTRLWEEYPEAMKAALARHDGILREAVDSHAGHVVKTTGDELHVAFGLAEEALGAAGAAQAALGAERHRRPRRALAALYGAHQEERKDPAGNVTEKGTRRAARNRSGGPARPSARLERALRPAVSFWARAIIPGTPGRLRGPILSTTAGHRSTEFSATWRRYGSLPAALAFDTGPWDSRSGPAA
jgi:hypothetical protein